MKTNAFFENLDRIAREYEKRHDAHKELKQQILDTKGWDSEELKAWYKEEKNSSNTRSAGEPARPSEIGATAKRMR